MWPGHSKCDTRAALLDPLEGEENTEHRKADSGDAEMRAPVQVLTAIGMAALLAACSTLDGNQTPAPSPPGGGEPISGFSRFTDVPMPPNNSIDLDRTIVFGVDKDWIGRIALSTSMSVGEVYDFFKREMPRLGWTELTSVRSATSVLSYQQDNRIATIQVSSARLWGSKIDFWMNPRAQGGMSTFGSGGGSAPMAAPRGGPIDQSPLPARR